VSKKTLGVMAVGQIGARATQDYVSPMIAGYIPAIGPLDGLSLTNAGLGVVAISLASSKKIRKEQTKLGAAILGTRLLTDVAYDVVKGMLPTTAPTPTARYSRPMVRVASAAPAYGGGLVQVD